MSGLDLTPLLRSSLAQPEALTAAIESVGATLGVSDVVVYLVDFGQTVLEPLGDHARAELPHSEEVASTMAGRAFLTQTVVMADRAGGVRLWAPIVEDPDRSGVLAVTLPDKDPQKVEACRALGILAGYLLTVNGRVSDLFNLHRRRKAMTLAASLQWDLLPPLVFRSPLVTVAGILEPAYEVGGDCFDYSINWPVLDVALMDSMGHGLTSSILASLALGCYRHDRRHGVTLTAMHQQLEATVREHYEGSEFVTGQLAQLNVETGLLQWTNAGHPLPLHIRGGQVIADLPCPPTLPWGLGAQVTKPTMAEVSLEPGDAVLFYTDGAIEGKASSGGGFGREGLVDIVGQTASDLLTAEEIVRRIGRAVLEHHGERLDDDATLVIVQWEGAAH